MKKVLPEKFRYFEYRSDIKIKNEIQKKHSTCILILSFNEIENVKKISSYLSKKINLLDVCFVDNNSSDGTFDFLKNNYGSIFNIILTKENLGGAGGFCIGQEWVIERGYDYCILTEADAYPLDEDLIESLLKNKKQNQIVLARYYEQNLPSFSFHYSLYPVEFFKKIGVVNKNLFFRADDWEYGERMGKILKNEYKIEIINKFYSHPIIKKGFKITANYFHFRNGLLVRAKYPAINSVLDVTRNFLLYTLYSFFSFFNDKNITVLKQFYFAFFDFLKRDLSRNKEMLERFKNEELKPKEKIKFLEDDFFSFLRKYKNFKIVSPLIKKTFAFHFNFSGAFFSVDCISSKFASSNQVIAFLFKRIVFVEEIDFLEKKIYYFEYHNKKLLESWFCFFISLFLSFLSYLILFPLILWTIFRIKKE
jgi:GT2 family glycosyltransferase